MEAAGLIKTENIFELPTYQRRLRHLKSVAVRNLKCSHSGAKDITKLQAFFTLHKTRTSTAFYSSEKITGSLNPSWQSFDMSRYDEDIDTRSQNVHLRVWVGQSDSYRLLLDWSINLTGLVFHADKLQDLGVKYTANTVIFGMFDKFFRAPESHTQQTNQVPVAPGSHHVMKVESSVTRNSYTSSSLSRIYTVLRAIKQTQASVNRIHHSIEDRLLSSQEKSRKLALREDLLLKRGQLRNEATWQASLLQQAKETHSKKKATNDKSESDLNDKKEKLDRERRALGEKRKVYNQTRESLIKENAQLAIRRKQLLSELATYIYPITEKKENEFFICKVRLPNSEEFQGQDETMIATSLGYTCHLVLMMSHTLDIPLRYPMVHRGSRSLIRDHIHTKLTDKDREFPLYSKGKERFQFNYGVFLLNKNISQMRFYLGLGTTDLRTTLQNIKTLMELRLGLKVDVMQMGKLYQSGGSEGKERVFSDFDKTETQSSHTSMGRISLPDSLDARLLEPIDPGIRNSNQWNIPDQNSDVTRLSNSWNIPEQAIYVRNDRAGDFQGEEMFHPSEDKFFKVASPPSEKLDILNSFDGMCAIEDQSSVLDRKTLSVDEGFSDSLQMTSNTNSYVMNEGLERQLSNQTETLKESRLDSLHRAIYNGQTPGLACSGAILNGDAESGKDVEPTSYSEASKVEIHKS